MGECSGIDEGLIQGNTNASASTAVTSGMMSSAPSIPLRLDGNDACVADLGLWLDPHRARDFAFVSHAHADHFAPHGRILCSTPTRRLIEARYGAAAQRAGILDLAFGEVREVDGYRVELLPAGHIPGSAMLFLERLDDGATLLHTGDFKTRAAPGAEGHQGRHADTLIMETTFGLPKFRFPAGDEVLAAMVKFALEAIEEGEIPVFMAYALGKAQEILIALHERAPGLRFQVHESVAKMNAAVASLGYSIPVCEVFHPKERSPGGHVVIVPPNAGRGLAIRRLRKSIRLAMVSGWGMEPGAKYRYQCDEVFPLSDHAGYDDLLSFVETVAPSRVLTIHGYTGEFAADLRRRGIEAWPLFGETQLELESLVPETSLVSLIGADGAPAPRGPESGFGTFAAVCGRIAAVTGKLKKRDILAAYLASLPDEEIEAAVRFLAARPFPREEGIRAANVGWSLIRQALLDLSGLTLAQLRQVSASQADAARTTYLILQGRTTPEPRSLAEISEFFRELAREKGQSAKLRRLRVGLSGLSPGEGALFVGILTGDLRIGLKEGLLEEALAAAFDKDPAEVREANMLLGDLGETVRLAREGRLAEAGARWFNPIRVMLASPEDDAEAIVARQGGEGRMLWLEDKFDGIRAQLHRRGDEVGIYSRDLRPLHAEFPEIAEAARGLDRDVILDGEIIAFAEGKKLTFFDLQKRLGRRDTRLDQGDLFFGEAVPVRFVAFDLLGCDGGGWLDRPLSERRVALESLKLPAGIDRCEVVHARNAAEVDEAFNAAKRRGNEGLIAKEPASRYTPGRRGKQWLKLKKAMPTLDVVVVKAQQGHGKRAHVLSDYTFAVRDEESGGLRVIGKAYSGLTDAEIEELTAHFRERTVEKIRSVHVVEPDTVLEIAFDSIQSSKRHDSGLSLRFPRIKAIRRDKTPEEIDTLAYARKLAGL